MIKSVLSIKVANVEPFEISQTDVSLNVRGSLKRECAVRPPGNNKAAIPADATGSTTLPTDLSLAIIVLYKKVLPVPPAPYTKNN